MEAHGKREGVCILLSLHSLFLSINEMRELSISSAERRLLEKLLRLVLWVSGALEHVSATQGGVPILH